MAIVDLSIFDEELGDCYKFSRNAIVNLHFNNENVGEDLIFDKAMGNVKDRFLQSVYLSFKGFEHIYYYDCSNPDIPKIEFPGILVLPSSDGLHRYEFENTNKVSVVLSDNNGNKHEFTIESSGLYRIEDGQVIKSDSYDLLDEIIQFRYEMTRIYLSPRIFPEEDFHTCEEILNELINRRKSGEGKVFLTQFITPKNVDNYKITENQAGVGVIVNNIENVDDKQIIEGDGIMKKKKMVRKKLDSSSVTSSELASSSTSITTETTIHETITIEISESTTTTNVVSEEVKKCTCNDQCPPDCSCVDNCTPECSQCQNNNKQIVDEDNNNNIENPVNEKTENTENPVNEKTENTENIENTENTENIENLVNEKTENTENPVNEKTENTDNAENTVTENTESTVTDNAESNTGSDNTPNENKIHIYTTYDNIHVWDCDVKSDWPGLLTSQINGDKWKEIVLDATHCFLIGNFSGSNASRELNIDSPGKYHLEDNILTKQ